MPGTEAAPLAHDFGGGRKQAVLCPAIETLEPHGDLLPPFSVRKKFDAFDDFSEGDGGKAGFVIVEIEPFHDVPIR